MVKLIWIFIVHIYIQVNGYTCKFGHHFSKVHSFYREEFASIVFKSIQKWGLLSKEWISSLWEQIHSLKGSPNENGNKYFHDRVITLDGVSVPFKGPVLYGMAWQIIKGDRNNDIYQTQFGNNQIN